MVPNIGNPACVESFNSQLAQKLQRVASRRSEEATPSPRRFDEDTIRLKLAKIDADIMHLMQKKEYYLEHLQTMEDKRMKVVGPADFSGHPQKEITSAKSSPRPRKPSLLRKLGVSL
eukprot:jgi/Mesen1/3607/ME000020S03127